MRCSGWWQMNIDEGLTALVGATITGAALYEGDGDLVGVYSLQVRCADGRDHTPGHARGGHANCRHAGLHVHADDHLFI